MLNNSISQNPSPPMNLGFVISSQGTRQVFRWPSFAPHKNFLISELMCSHNPWGNLKQDMENFRITYTTDFIRTSFPPADKPWILFQILSLIYLKAPFVERPTLDGIPKYFSLRVSFWTFEMSFISCLITDVQCLMKKIEDLSRFTRCPEAQQ